MHTYIDKIREIAARLLKEETIEMVIGYQEGTLPMISPPMSAKTAEDVDRLTWSSHCCINLANYLTDVKGKVAVFAKGCDCRSIVNHIAEGKVKRENVVIIGVPCNGMMERRTISNIFGNEIEEVIEEADGTVIVRGKGREEKYQKSDLLRQCCRVCVHKNPVLYDELVADPVAIPEDIQRYKEVEKIEAREIDKRWKFFENLVSTCIRCYACRDACPTCYCPTCFVDEAQPQWVGKGDDEPDVMTFHILRAFHTAGRCTDCGACVSACPMGINMRAFTKKLEKDCLDLWDWEAGLTSDMRPALETFTPSDPEDNFK